MSRNAIINGVTPTLSSVPFNNQKSAYMHNVAAKAFENSYLEINKTNLSQKDKIIAAQKIANVILKTYSPVAFVAGALDQYADNYMLKNSALLQQQLETLNVKNVDETIKDVEAALSGRTENQQTEPEKLDTHELFKAIENNLNKTKNENTVVVEPQPKEEPKPVYSVPPIPGMNSKFKQENKNDAPKLTEEERQAKELADAKAALVRLKNIRTGTTEERSNRERMINYYQGIVNKYKSPDELFKESLELSEKARREAQEREEREKQLKELENSEKNDIIEDKEHENLPLDSGNEATDPSSLRIDDFYNKFDLRMGNQNVAAQVKAEMTEILKEAGITDQKKAFDIVEASYFEIKDTINSLYDSNIVTEVKMSTDAPLFFYNAFLSIKNTDLSTKDRIITAQKFADVMIKNYSPVAFVEKELDRFADNYVLNDSELLATELLNLGFSNPEADKLINEILGVPENGQLDPTVAPIPQQPQPEPPEQEQVQQQQPEPPKQEQVQQPELPEQEQVQQPEPPKQKQVQPSQPPISSEARVAVYEEKLKAYDNMYKLNIDSNHFASSVTEAWALMTSGDKQKMSDGQKIMNNLFKETLKKAFDVEKGVAYNEHRLPEYAEIVKSTNELMRSAMYGFTDLYHNPNRKNLFDETAFGGLNAKDMGELTTGNSLLWGMDQNSDEAWELQSKEAKGIADKWLKEDKPYEKMINEMKTLVDADKKSIVSRKEVLDKLTAAEWLLTNNEKMMIEDPEDPYNPIPNWGNRYWKALTETREALGIDKHTSMRDLIQSDYAASAKAVNNRTYNETQINNYVLDEDVRELADSMEVQKEQFATMSAAVTLTKPTDKNPLAVDMTADRVQYPIKELDERDIMKHEPKIYNFVGDPKTEKNLNITNQGQTK